MDDNNDWWWLYLDEADADNDENDDNDEDAVTQFMPNPGRSSRRLYEYMNTQELATTQGLNCPRSSYKLKW